MSSKASTLIFGGSGKVARHITRLLAAEENHEVYSIIRKPEQQADITALGGKPIVASIEESSVEAMTATIRDSKATTVIWAAGAGAGDPARTLAVDRDGAIRSMDATAAAGVKRYLIISAIDTRDRENPQTEPKWYNDEDRARSEGCWSKIGAYMKAKLAADRSLVTDNGRRNLDYTILRPGSLSLDESKGTIAAGEVHISPTIPREDVAKTVVEIIRQNAFHRTAYDIVGGETPIKDAVAEMARTRTDTFEGRY